MAYDYTEQALSALDRAEHLTKTNPETGLLLAEAQVWATLAQQEQLRITNLIAIAQFSHEAGSGERIFTNMEGAAEWRNAAMEGLGLS